MTTIYLDSIDQFKDLYTGFAETVYELDYSELMFKFIEDLVLDHTAYFDLETGPDEGPWPPHSEEWAAHKGHSTILYYTGRLRESLTGFTEDTIREFGEDSFSFGTTVPYSIYQQEIRPHVGVSEWRMDQWAEQVAQLTLQTIDETNLADKGLGRSSSGRFTSL